MECNNELEDQVESDTALLIGRLRQRLDDAEDLPVHPAARPMRLPLRNNSPDNFQTPKCAIDVLVPFMRDGATVWEVAAGEGNLVKAFSAAGFNCFGTDIETGFDFLTHTQYDDYDYIVTNPPYSKGLKDKFLHRCCYLDKPFALLMPITAQEGEKRIKLYQQYGIQIINVYPRLRFKTPAGLEGKASSPHFASSWYTRGFNLPDRLIWRKVVQ